ncbi:hypothetical protein [Deinococcus sp. QL22]|uniref:hypothetical protein n=1 Tax=Deinococcus sp. QL22 TaxID=2939437 RepID=UPI002017DDD9|nr:hypothetical protein [Deinococcus sp. QL22]UQN10727.1 hypothetical protein M1R55_30410 [Deinococcus sp. QL22]
MSGVARGRRRGGLKFRAPCAPSISNTINLTEPLRLQARLGLAFALKHPPERYTLQPARLLPEPTAGISGPDLLQALVMGEPLPLDTVFCLGQTAVPVTLSPDQWRLLRWVNGRRTLARAMETSGLEPDNAQQMARQLMTSGLVHPSAVVGLRLIVVRLKPASSLYQPPSSIRANLFLRHLDGVRDVWTIAETLKFPTEEAATLLVALHRDNVVEVVRGTQELARLDEEF